MNAKLMHLLSKHHVSLMFQLAAAQPISETQVKYNEDLLATLAKRFDPTKVRGFIFVAACEVEAGDPIAEGTVLRYLSVNAGSGGLLDAMLAERMGRFALERQAVDGVTPPDGPEDAPLAALVALLGGDLSAGELDASAPTEH